MLNSMYSCEIAKQIRYVNPLRSACGNLKLGDNIGNWLLCKILNKAYNFQVIVIKR